MGDMHHADTQAVTYLLPECAVCRPGKDRRGVLARSSELAEGGRPGSRPAVTFNLDLVSIGVSNPASTVEFVRIPHRGMTPSHLCTQYCIYLCNRV